MTKKITVALLLGLGGLSCYAYIFSGVITEVESGCTLKVVRRKKIETVKLADIECATQPSLARKAKQKIEDLALDKKVTVNVRSISENTKFAQITVLNGPNLAYELVREGYAKFTGDITSDNPLLQAQKDARKTKKGAWGAQAETMTATSKTSHAGTDAKSPDTAVSGDKSTDKKTAKKKVGKKKSFFDHSISEMLQISYDYIKKNVDKFLGFLDKVEKSQVEKSQSQKSQQTENGK